MQISLLDVGKIEQSPDCVSAYDNDLKILIWNKTCEQKYGIPKADALHHNLLHLFPGIKQDFRVQCFRKCLKEQESFFFPNLPLLYSDGIYSQVILPLHDERKGIIGLLNIVREGEYKRLKKEDLVQPLCVLEAVY